ncbi:hypothetical protein DL93DRAFT_2072892 [Clavulina sp. PMI_390]|nr:hypothetical protein DL93DRAFT_2072892 [Clavulina sp. PMI_390]
MPLSAVSGDDTGASSSGGGMVFLGRSTGALALGAAASGPRTNYMSPHGFVQHTSSQLGSAPAPTPHPDNQQEQHAADNRHSLVQHPRPSPSSPLPAAAQPPPITTNLPRAQTLPTPTYPYSYSKSAPATRRNSPINLINTLHAFRASAAGSSSQSPATSRSSGVQGDSGSPDSYYHPSSFSRSQAHHNPNFAISPITPDAGPSSRPPLPVRSTSSASFLTQSTPRVRSRRRNASGNRISLVAGRRVPLPFDPTIPIDPLPPLIVRNSSESGTSQAIVDTSTAAPATQTQPEAPFVTSADPTSSPSTSPRMPIIAPLLHPPEAPPSRIPSSTCVAAPNLNNQHSLAYGSTIASTSANTSANVTRTPSASSLVRSPSGPSAEAGGSTSAATDEINANVAGSVPLGLSRSTSSSKSKLSRKKSRSKEKDAAATVGARTVDDFVIIGEAGRGAYGLVKRVKEKMPDGTLGPLLIMKQVIKSRILADCWKKHVSYGTIPIEIHVMAALSSSEYVLPPSRPWDPLRFDYWAKGEMCSTPAADATEMPMPMLDSLGRVLGHGSRASSIASTAEGGRGSISSLPSSDEGTGSTSTSTATATTFTPSHSYSSSISTSTPSKPPPYVTNREHYKLDLNQPGIGFFQAPPKDGEPAPSGPWQWRAGAIHHGHPSIIPLLEFFEDAHFYYLILPAATPSFPRAPHFPHIDLPSSHPSLSSGMPSLAGSPEKKFPSDLFDLVERFPYGLPPPLIRTYLGQIADGLAFLHARGICHRDIKDENVVLAEDGRCWLIDFGSSGVVRKEGWDSFSGTLDYAGPEILRGETYKGPPQDVWAFGIVSYVLVVGECPFSSAAEAAIGLAPGSKALEALEERCGRPAFLTPRPPSIEIDVNPPVLFPAPSPLSSSSPGTPPTVAPPQPPKPSVTELDFSDFFGGPAPVAPPVYDAEREQARMEEGRELDGGGRLGDAMALIRACLQLDTAQRPTFEEVLRCRYLSGAEGWVELEEIHPPSQSPLTTMN